MTSLERAILHQIYEWMMLDVSREGETVFCPDIELDRQLRLRTRACAKELLLIYCEHEE